MLFDIKEVICRQQWMQILAILSGSLISLNGGLFFAWPSPSIPILTTAPYNFTRHEASFFTVIPSFASIIASPIWAMIMNIIGRKSTLLLVAIPQFTSWMFIAQSETVIMFYIARFISGMAQSCIYAVLPVYIGEICSPGVRGLWGNTMSFSVYFGLFLMNLVGSHFTIQVTAYVFGIIPIVFLGTFIFMPESPYYHIMKKNMDEGKACLRRLRNGKKQHSVDEEFQQLVKHVTEQMNENEGSFKDLFFDKMNRNLLMLGIAIRAMQQYSGISAFNSYSQIMFGNNNATTFALIYTGSLSASVFTGSIVLDKIGRRNAMTVSAFMCGVSLTLEAIFSYMRHVNPDIIEELYWFPIVGMIFYVLSYSIGLGIVPNLILGELYPSNMKGKALCIITICFGLFSSSSNWLYEFLLRKAGDHFSFGIFAICCFISSVISYCYVPETSGKTLEQIQQTFKEESKEREIVKELKTKTNIIEVYNA